MHKQPQSQWPGPFDASVIDAMLNDPNSHHWSECQTYVNRLVLKWASGFSVEVKEEIAQNAMLWIVRYLPNFKRQCRLTTWIIQIVHTRIADAGREQQTSFRRQALPLNDFDEDDENEVYNSKISSPRTVEEECVSREELREAFNGFTKYLSTHPKSERVRLILEMHMAGFNQQDIARDLKIPAPNVGYAIRTFQRFLREQQ
jgi:RNA polymerase sigma factor (sigma-70 family)